jgi:hypothetical protein
MKLQIDVVVNYDKSKLGQVTQQAQQDAGRAVQQASRQSSGGGRGAVGFTGMPAPQEIVKSAKESAQVFQREQRQYQQIVRASLNERRRNADQDANQMSRAAAQRFKQTQSENRMHESALRENAARDSAMRSKMVGEWRKDLAARLAFNNTKSRVIRQGASQEAKEIEAAADTILYAGARTLAQRAGLPMAAGLPLGKYAARMGAPIAGKVAAAGGIAGVGAAALAAVVPIAATAYLVHQAQVEQQGEALYGGDIARNRIGRAITGEAINTNLARGGSFSGMIGAGKNWTQAGKKAEAQEAAMALWGIMPDQSRMAETLPTFMKSAQRGNRTYEKEAAETDAELAGLKGEQKTRLAPDVQASKSMSRSTFAPLREMGQRATIQVEQDIASEHERLYHLKLQHAQEEQQVTLGYADRESRLKAQAELQVTESVGAQRLQELQAGYLGDPSARAAAQKEATRLTANTEMIALTAGGEQIKGRATEAANNLASSQAEMDAAKEQATGILRKQKGYDPTEKQVGQFIRTQMAGGAEIFERARARELENTAAQKALALYNRELSTNSKVIETRKKAADALVDETKAIDENVVAVSAKDIQGQADIRQLSAAASYRSALTADPAKRRAEAEGLALETANTADAALMTVSKGRRNKEWEAKRAAVWSDYKNSVNQAYFAETLEKRKLGIEEHSIKTQTDANAKIANLQNQARLSDSPAVRYKKEVEASGVVLEMQKSELQKQKDSGVLNDAIYKAKVAQAEKEKLSSDERAKTEMMLGSLPIGRAFVSARAGIVGAMPGMSGIGRSAAGLRGLAQEQAMLPPGFSSERRQLQLQQGGSAMSHLYEIGSSVFSPSEMAKQARAAQRQVGRGARRIALIKENEEGDRRRGVKSDPTDVDVRRQITGQGGAGEVAGSAADRMMQAANLFLQAAGVLAKGGNAFTGRERNPLPQ